MSPYHQLFTITTQEEAKAYGQPIGAEIWVVSPAQETTLEDDIKHIIECHREKLKIPLSSKEPTLLFKPLQSVWVLPDKGNLKDIEQRFKQGILNSLHVAWYTSEEWIAEFRQESTQQPHRAEEIFNEYWLHYEGLVTKYNVFRNWALELWPEPAKPETPQLIKGMWGELWTLCYTENIEFGIGLSILESVFAANLTIAKLSRERMKPFNSQSTPATSVLPVSIERIQPGFDTYIVEEQRAKLMPYLIKHYSNATPEQCGFMLYALARLSHLSPSTMNSNQTALHRAMKKTFGQIGTRQALNTAILRLDPTDSSDEDKRNIAEHTRRISQFLSSSAAE